MLDSFGATQKRLLVSLLNTKAGLTADLLVEKAGVTRTAIRQHMMALENMGYVEHGPEQETGGRPAILYKLSPKGYELFPKQYSWFSELMLQMILKERGESGLLAWMDEMGTMVGKSLNAQLEGKSGKDRLDAITATMSQMAYEAQTVEMSDSKGGYGIEAINCVYHALAARFPQVCQFDLSLLSTVTGKQINHTSCMVRGGESCRFALAAKKDSGA